MIQTLGNKSQSAVLDHDMLHYFTFKNTLVLPIFQSSPALSTFLQILSLHALALSWNRVKCFLIEHIIYNSVHFLLNSSNSNHVLTLDLKGQVFLTVFGSQMTELSRTR